MKASLRSAPIAPKKANLIAKMVRGMPADDAVALLSRTHKKGARMVEKLLKSALANAEHNDKQDPQQLHIKTIVVNQAMGYRRGVPKARGSIRPMTKFLSHISLTLGLADASKPAKSATKSAAKKPSQAAKNTVKGSGSSSPKKKPEPKAAKPATDDSAESQQSAASASDSSSS